MNVTLDTRTLQLMNMFQNITGSDVTDCIDNPEDIYFVVKENQYGLAVGKNGVKIRHAERLMKKGIRVFEYSPDVKMFIANVIPEAQEIVVDGGIVTVRIKKSDRARVIGRNGTKIKAIGKFLERLFDVKMLKLK